LSAGSPKLRIAGRIYHPDPLITRTCGSPPMDEKGVRAYG
jgi:hypothetical protein